METNPIIEIFSRVHPLSYEARKEFISIFQHRSYAKKVKLLEYGHVADSLFYIKKGLARAFYNREGTEVTYYFAIDNQFIGAVPSLFDKQPSHKAIQLIEDSEVIQFAYSDFERCCSQHQDLEIAARKISSLIILREQERNENLRFFSARERFELLEKQYPGISNRCPLKYLASYIGTSPVSLSRIRAGIQ